MWRRTDREAVLEHPLSCNDRSRRSENTGNGLRTWARHRGSSRRENRPGPGSGERHKRPTRKLVEVCQVHTRRIGPGSHFRDGPPMRGPGKPGGLQPRRTIDQRGFSGRCRRASRGGNSKCPTVTCGGRSRRPWISRCDARPARGRLAFRPHHPTGWRILRSYPGRLKLSFLIPHQGQRRRRSKLPAPW